ncbi:MAG: quinolinate synthase NadA, partial [Victivallaceae bacterium]|nr:quinolinate synthase NadA [Victivallaceae bacterium]
MTELNQQEIVELINKLRKERNAVILVHNYQLGEVQDIGDYVGDSLGLSIEARDVECDVIVFCGVRFMAETAKILSPDKTVLLPVAEAGCPMADMAKLPEVEETWRQIDSILNNDMPVPITYVNSNAEIKAFCGMNNGITCTSSNAKKVILWALERGKRFLFLPDEHLGRNSARDLQIPKNKIILWDPKLPFGGNTPGKIRNAVAILWNGFCHVHTFFTVDHVRRARQMYKDCKVVVHPECPEEVVLASDADGSTGFIVRYV